LGYLIAALAAPVAGPVLYRLLHGRARAARLVDGFVYLSVPALVAWQVLAVAWADRSVLPLIAVGAGLLVPEAMERVSRALARMTDDLAILIALSGVVLHDLLEGAAFAPGEEGVAPAFALAVILHRVPVGLVIWWLIRPRHGIGLASLGIATTVLATLAGFGIGGEILGDAHGPMVELYQAFVSGSLVHVVFHQGRHDHSHDDRGEGGHDGHEGLDRHEGHEGHEGRG
jgi:zinc transporter ZupT